MGSMKIWTGSAWEIASTQGPAGPPALPAGGTTGQVLAKTSATNYDVSWQTATSTAYLPLVGGTMAEGGNIAVGTTTGTKIGTTATQKLGFWGTAPATQNPGWSVSAAYSSVRVFNPNSTTLTEVAKVLATLVDILKGYGLLGAP